MKVFADDGSLWDSFDAGGDAWGDPNYGFEGPMPPGHFILGASQRFAPIASEGIGQIPVSDMNDVTRAALIKDGKATAGTASIVTIGQLSLPTGQLSAFNRSAVMLHGGGSNLAGLNPPQNPLAPFQQLCKTEGCTRLHNADWARLADFIDGHIGVNTVVYSAVGHPLSLAL